MSVNKVILLGHVGKQPEIRTLNNGSSVATFSLATSEYWKDKNSNEKKEKTEWHKIVVFDSVLVDLIKNFIQAGTKLYVEGSLRNRSYTDNNNIERNITEIVVQGYDSKLEILTSSKKDVNNNNTNEEVIF